MAIRNDFAPGEVLAAADLNDTFGSKLDVAGGKILQVVSTTKTDTFTTSSTSMVDVTGLSVSITPSAANSKVFVMVNGYAGSEGGLVALRGQLVRNSTAIAIGDASGSRTRVSVESISSTDAHAAPISVSVLDAPNSIVSVTYKLQVSANTANAVFINRSRTDSDASTTHRTVTTITAMEVSA
jgi:hypothetical protein